MPSPPIALRDRLTPVEACELTAELPAVFGVLQKRIAAGEIDDIRGVLPDQFAALWPED